MRRDATRDISNTPNPWVETHGYRHAVAPRPRRHKLKARRLDQGRAEDLGGVEGGAAGAVVDLVAAAGAGGGDERRVG